MAKPVLSPWSVTFDLGGPHEHILTEPGLFLEEEPQGLASTQETEAGDYIDEDDSEPMARGKVKKKFGLTVFRDHASEAAARDFMFSHELTVPVNVRGTLTVSFTGGSTWVLSNCVFKSWATVPVKYHTPPRTATTYELECGKLSQGTPAGPDPIGLETGLLAFTRVEGLRNALASEAQHLDAVAEWTNSGTLAAAAAQATAGQRPKRLLGPGLYLPGTAGNWYGMLNHANLTPGLEFGIRWDGVLPDYTPAARVALVAKWTTTGDQRSWALYLEPTGQLTLAVSTDGTAGTVTEWTSTLPVGIAGGTQVGIGVRKFDNKITWELMPDLEWDTRIAFSPETAITTGINAHDATAPIEYNSTSGGTADLALALVKRVQWFHALAGFWGADSTVFLQDFTGETPSPNVLPSSEAAPAGTGADPKTVIGARSNHGPRFDGTNDSLALDNPAQLNGIAGCSVYLYLSLTDTTGTRDLFFAATAGTAARVLLRLTGGNIELHVRRLDAEAAAVISAPLGSYANKVSASIDYAAGTATLYLGGNPVAAGALTSAGNTEATDSSETRLMAGQGGANPAAGDLWQVQVMEEASTVFDHARVWASITGFNG